MKMRTGFVSNSSSSSFACVLPKSFDITKVDFSKCNMEDNDLEPQDVIKAFEKFLDKRHLVIVIVNGKVRGESKMVRLAAVESVAHWDTSVGKALLTLRQSIETDEDVLAAIHDAVN